MKYDNKEMQCFDSTACFYCVCLKGDGHFLIQGIRVSANRSELTTLILLSRQDEDPLSAAEVPSLFLQKNLLRELSLPFPSRFPRR